MSAVDDRQRGGLPGQDFHLFQRFGQGVAVVGITRQGQHIDHDTRVDGDGEANLGSNERGEVMDDIFLTPRIGRNRPVVAACSVAARWPKTRA